MGLPAGDARHLVRELLHEGVDSGELSTVDASVILFSA